MTTLSFDQTAAHLDGLCAAGAFYLKSHAAHHVYALWRHGSIVYIGYSARLERRIHQHQRRKDFDAYSSIGFDKRADALNAERALILKLSPALNMAKTTSAFTLTQAERQAEWLANLPADRRRSMESQRAEFASHCAFMAGLA